MYVHWTEDPVAKEEISFLVSKNCSQALLGRLMARIARRQGRPRRRMPTNRIIIEWQRPNLSEAA